MSLFLFQLFRVVTQEGCFWSKLESSNDLNPEIVDGSVVQT